MPINSKVQLMMASLGEIAEGAKTAAEFAIKNRKNNPELAILVSCVQRKLAMNQRVEEEFKPVQEVIGEKISVTGFYSCGEIVPFNEVISCELHNQTITLTLIS